MRRKAPTRGRASAVLLLTAAGAYGIATLAGQEALPPGPGSEVARAACLTCHGADLIAQQRLGPAGWDREVEKMIGWGAAVEGPQREALVEYLSAHFGPSGGAAAPAGHPGSALVGLRCLGCHDRRLIEQQRLTAQGWEREVDKMIGWGAAVTAAEKPVLVEYLAAGWSP